MASAHPTDDMLASYAAGAAPEGAALLVACHLTFCPRCRRMSPSVTIPRRCRSSSTMMAIFRPLVSIASIAARIGWLGSNRTFSI